MRDHRTRALLALVALGLFVAGGGLVTMAGRTPEADAAQTFTVAIYANGYDPATCTMNRNYSTVYFQNKDTKPRRIVVPLLPLKNIPPTMEGVELRMDTGVIAPGATNESGWFTNQVDDFMYYDYDNPRLNGRMIVPLSNSASSDCDQAGAAPTPPVTPTSVPTVPSGRPLACLRVFAQPLGCNIVPHAAADPH